MIFTWGTAEDIRGKKAKNTKQQKEKTDTKEASEKAGNKKRKKENRKMSGLQRNTRKASNKTTD